MKRWWIRHPETGELRAYLDGESAGQERLAAHLRDCRACCARVSELERIRQQTAATLALLAADLDAELTNLPIPPLASKEVVPMNAPVRRFLPVAAATAAGLFLVSIVAVPPLRAKAADWLSVFRTEKIATVRIDRSQLQTSIDTLQGKITPEEALRLAGLQGKIQPPSPVAMTREEATALLGNLRAPAQLPADLSVAAAQIHGLRPVDYTLRPDVDGINAWLQQQGMPVQLSEQLRGQTFQVTTPALVAQMWHDDKGHALVFIQGFGPQVKGTGSVDMQEMVDMVARLAGLPTDVTEQLRAIPDLAHTVVLPAMSDASQQVTVAGQPGVYDRGRDGSGRIVWSEGGRMFMVGGTYSLDELLAVAGK